MQTQMENVCVTEWYNGIFFIKHCHQIIKSILRKDYAEPWVGIKKNFDVEYCSVDLIHFRQNKFFFVQFLYHSQHLFDLYLDENRISGTVKIL